MSNDKKKFWLIGGLVCVFLACLLVFIQQGKETSEAEEKTAKDTSDWVWGDIEDALPEGAVYVYPQKINKIQVPAGVDPQDYVLSKPEQNRKEEPEPELDPAELERLANWKANFPYKPATDPDVVITERMANYGKPESGDPTAEINHMLLRSFFESEGRFTVQFEQLYHILEERGRGDNLIAAAKIFDSLREYQKYMQKDPDEPKRSAYNHRLERPLTLRRTGREAQRSHRVLFACGKDVAGQGVYDGRQRPWLFATALYDFAGVSIKYIDELEEGENFELDVGENNVLLANGKPLVYDEREHTAVIVTPDGIEGPLHLHDNSNVIIPSPSEIAEMIENGEGKYVEIPDENSNQPPPYITEEEWKLQEALRQLEEANRQQE